MPDVTIKETTINSYNIEIRLVNRYGVNFYEVTTAYLCGAGYRVEKCYTSPDRKKALATYNRYKRAIQA